MKKLKLITLLTGVALGAAAQTVDSVYSVEKCVEMALQNSRQAKNARNDVAAAVELKREAFTKYFPEISAMGMVFWANHDILQYNLLDLVELGIIKKGKMAGVQAMQPVFTGGQIVNGNKLAEVGEEVAKLRAEQSDNDVRLTTETLFWKLTALEATKATLDAALQTLDSIETQVNVAVDAGIVLKNDLLKVELKRNTYKTEMVDLENGISLVRMLLCQYMGIDLQTAVTTDAGVPSQVPECPYNLYITPQDALYSTIDFRLLEKNVQAKRLEKRMELGKNLPTVAVGAGWYYHDVLEQNHNFGAVQIGVAIPISGWWGGSHALKRKSLQLMNAENERDDLSQKLEINIRDKWNELTSAHRKLEISAESINQSRENLRLSQMYYEAGMNTVSDLLEAETGYKETLEKFITAYGSFRIAMAAYKIATGR